MFDKKTRVKKSCDTVPFNHMIAQCEDEGVAKIYYLVWQSLFGFSRQWIFVIPQKSDLFRNFFKILLQNS
jgi:hypothetical protein